MKEVTSLNSDRNRFDPDPGITFYWNGQELTAENKQNLLQAVLDNDVEVTHYCHHKGLSSVGACRMCLAMKEGESEIFLSCEEKVVEGARYQDNHPSIRNAKKFNLLGLLNNHLVDCHVCDQSGECVLQSDYNKFFTSNDKNITTFKLDDTKSKKLRKIDDNIVYDESKCLLCFRCVRFVQEITRTDELGIVGNGDDLRIECHKKLSDNSCSENIVDICPVGALTSLDFRFKAPAWMLEEVESVCIGCEVGCAISVSQDQKSCYRTRPLMNNTDLKNWICNQGRSVHQHVSGYKRIKSILENRGGFFERASQDDIIQKIKKRFPKFILSTFLTNEEYRRFFDEVRKLNKVDVALYSIPRGGTGHSRRESACLPARDNKNPNRKGAVTAFENSGFDHSEKQLGRLLKNLAHNDVLYIVVPEIMHLPDHFNDMLKNIDQAGIKIALTPNNNFSFLKEFNYLLPISTFLEKDGTMTNFEDGEGRLNPGISYGAGDREPSHYVQWDFCKEK